MTVKQPSPPDIPIVFCKACNRAPMIARTIREHPHGVDVDFECPSCGATVAEKLAAPAQSDGAAPARAPQ